MRYPAFLPISGLFLALSAAPAAAAPGQTKACPAHYTGPLDWTAEDDGRLMTLLRPYGFADSHCTLWIVPAGTSVDGASIPRPFWSLIGGPFEGKYRNASVVHDWFCKRKSRPWQSVHRMFYDAMLASGVDRAQAKIMYGAVYIGGPRWTEQAIVNYRLANPAVLLGSKEVDPGLLQRYQDVAFAGESKISPGARYIIDRIEAKDISLDEIDRLAEQTRAIDGTSDAGVPKR